MKNDETVGMPDITSQDEVLERLCQISLKVAEHFGFNEAADCFCGSNPAGEMWPAFGYRYSEKVLAFIEAAVRDRTTKGYEGENA